jgi:hypothetical protein
MELHNFPLNKVNGSATLMENAELPHAQDEDPFATPMEHVVLLLGFAVSSYIQSSAEQLGGQ